MLMFQHVCMVLQLLKANMLIVCGGRWMGDEVIEDGGGSITIV